jgi:hypothetical protein
MCHESISEIRFMEGEMSLFLKSINIARTKLQESTMELSLDKFLLHFFRPCLTDFKTEKYFHLHDTFISYKIG